MMTHLILACLAVGPDVPQECQDKFDYCVAMDLMRRVQLEEAHALGLEQYREWWTHRTGPNGELLLTMVIYQGTQPLETVAFTDVFSFSFNSGGESVGGDDPPPPGGVAGNTHRTIPFQPSEGVDPDGDGDVDLYDWAILSNVFDDEPEGG